MLSPLQTGLAVVSISLVVVSIGLFSFSIPSVVEGRALLAGVQQSLDGDASAQVSQRGILDGASNSLGSEQSKDGDALSEEGTDGALLPIGVSSYDGSMNGQVGATDESLNSNSNSSKNNNGTYIAKENNSQTGTISSEGDQNSNDEAIAAAEAAKYQARMEYEAKLTNLHSHLSDYHAHIFNAFHNGGMIETKDHSITKYPSYSSGVAHDVYDNFMIGYREYTPPNFNAPDDFPDFMNQYNAYQQCLVYEKNAIELLIDMYDKMKTCPDLWEDSDYYMSEVRKHTVRVNVVGGYSSLTIDYLENARKLYTSF